MCNKKVVLDCILYYIIELIEKHTTGMPCRNIVILTAYAQQNCDDDVPPSKTIAINLLYNNEKNTCKRQCVPAWRPQTQPNLREYCRPSYEWTPLCTDLRNNG